MASTNSAIYYDESDETGIVYYTADKGIHADKGKIYEQKVTAFISLQALRNLEDFSIMNNAPKCEPFDDIVLCTKILDRNVTYLFQVKLKQNPNLIIDEEFYKQRVNGKESKFHIETLCRKYNNKVAEIKKFLSEKYKENCNFKIVIYTNRGITEHSNCFEAVVGEETGFNTSDGKVFKITRKFLMKFEEAQRTFLKSIRIYAQQLERDVDGTSMLYITQEFNAESKRAKKIKLKFFKCIRNWCQIEDKTRSLTHEDIYKLLIFSVLQKFAVSMDDYEGTTYEKYQHVLQEESLNLLWESIKSNNINMSGKHIDFIIGKASEDFHKLKIESSFFKKIISNDEPLTEDYNIGCVLGKVPYIVEHFDLSLKQSDLTKQKIVFIESEGNLPKTHKDAIKALKPGRIRTESGQLLKVGDVLDKISEGASLSDLLDSILNSNINIVKKSEIFIKRKLQKVILTSDIFYDENLRVNNLFIIFANGISITLFAEYFNLNAENVLAAKNQYEIEEYLKKSVNPYYKYILVQNQNINFNFEFTKSLSVHFINIHALEETKVLEWLRTNGSTKDIKKFRINELCENIELELTETEFDNTICNCCVKLEEINSYFQNPFVIIHGVPGIGKSTVLKQFPSIVPANNFILFVELKKHYDYFENFETKSKPTCVIDHLKELCKESTIFNVEKVMITKKDNLIILLDGFDEIAPKYTKTVANIIQQIREENYNIILTTRSVLKKKVEEIFDTFSFTLTPFNESDRQQFLEIYHKTFCSDLTFWKFRKAILSNRNMDIHFYSVPFNFRVITEVVTNEMRNGSNTNFKINQLELYEKFLNSRILNYTEKISNPNIFIAKIIRYHKFLSISIIFKNLRDYNIIRNSLDNELKNYVHELKQGCENTGIVTEDLSEICIHRTVAEYFVARWLFELFNPSESDGFPIIEGEKEFANFVVNIINLSLTNNVDQNNNDLNYPVIRLFFDQMINKCDLHKAALEGNYRRIKEIFKDIASRNTLNEFNRSLLHTIITKNELLYDKKTFKINTELIEILKLVISNFTLTQKDFSGVSAQDYLEQKKSWETPLKILIHKSSSRNYVYFNREFELYEIFYPENLLECKLNELLSTLQIVQKLSTIFDAARNGHLPIIQQFSNSSIIINIEDKEGRSLMHYAAISGNINLIRYLKENGVNCVHRHRKLYAFNGDIFKIPNHYQPIHYAAAFYKKKVFEFFLHKKKENDDTLVFLSTINCIINEKFESHTKSDEAKKKLIRKKYNSKCSDFIYCLLQNKFDVNSKTINGFTSLMLATYFQNEDLINVLIENSADLNCINHYGQTALHLAACRNNIEILKLFFNRDKNCINKLDEAGNSVLHFAIYFNKNCIETVDFLIKNGANPTIANNRGMTPLHLAIDSLVNYDVIEVLVDATNEINARNINGNSALHYAVYRNNIDLVKYLIDKKADMNLYNKRNQTPLELANKLGYEEICSYMKEKKKYLPALINEIEWNNIRIEGNTMKTKNADEESIEFDYYKNRGRLGKISLPIEYYHFEIINSEPFDFLDLYFEDLLEL